MSKYDAEFSNEPVLWFWTAANTIIEIDSISPPLNLTKISWRVARAVVFRGNPGYSSLNATARTRLKLANVLWRYLAMARIESNETSCVLDKRMIFNEFQ